MMCEKYPEMISAYIDGELSEEEKAELEAHLNICEDCRSAFEIYREISEGIALDLEEPPEDFADNVMSRIAAEEGKKRRRVIRSFVGVAACAAIILLAMPLAIGTMKAGSAETNAFTEENSMADCAMPETYYAYDEAGAEEESCDTDDVTAAPADMPLKSAAQSYSLIVTVYGSVPEELREYDFEETENGEMQFVLPTEEAKKLAGEWENCETEIFDENLEEALVIVITE